MRKIVVEMADSGGTQVKIVGDGDRFFTARDMDRALRAIKHQYRHAKREYQKRKIIKGYEIEKEKELSNARSREQIERSVGSEEERNGSKDGVSGSSNSKLATAIANKRKREGQQEAGAGS